jgi:hypothetical protein
MQEKIKMFDPFLPTSFYPFSKINRSNHASKTFSSGMVGFGK